MNGYKRVHYRLAQDRGPASAYVCVDCGKQAREWSYRGGCANEEADPVGRLYSPSIWDYDPRCNGCHQRHDGRTNSPELMARITELARVANRGNGHTLGRVMPEHEKRQRSLSQKGRPKTAEHKEKLRQAALKRWARQRGEE